MFLMATRSAISICSAFACSVDGVIDSFGRSRVCRTNTIKTAKGTDQWSVQCQRLLTLPPVKVLTQTLTPRTNHRESRTSSAAAVSATAVSTSFLFFAAANNNNTSVTLLVLLLLRCGDSSTGRA